MNSSLYEFNHLTPDELFEIQRAINTLSDYGISLDEDMIREVREEIESRDE